ncbi:VanW family protein [Nocardioides sp. GXQ0305]|uniref:VanW family protein n=1 Tax=Nocardioides sp. GXQ0305 TaxID=3423912 RepID=UPI003D7F0B04
MSTDARESAGGKVVWLMLLVLALLLSGGYAAAYAAAGRDVPRGTTVEGVQIGGRPPAEAVAALEAGLAERTADPVRVEVDGEVLQVDPAEVGLSVDYEESVAAAGGGRSWHPSRLWDHYTGGDDLDAVVDVDDAALDAYVDRLADQVGTPARDGGVAFDGTRIDVTQPRTGRALDPDAAADAIVAGYLGDSPARIDLEATPPDVDQSDVRRAVDGFANPAMSGPVTILFEDSRVRLTPSVYARALGTEPRGGVLVPTLDRDRLARLMDRRISSNAEPVDARFRIVDGTPRIVPSRPGVTYDRTDLAEGFLDLVTRPEARRTQRVKATTDRPEFTTAEAKRLGIRRRVSTFTTYYPHADYRNTNIGRAGELVDGTVLEPGETFSLNDTVGERTRANGFTEGYVISDGILVSDLGGGVSQMATTTFNAAFFAGLEDVEHKPHSFYIDRYPVGREATVAWGSVDLRFRNDTRHGVLVTADVTPSTVSSSGVVTVSMWSTKTWDITARTGDRYNFTQEQTRRVDTRQCHPNDGYGGFDINVWRDFRRPGSSEVVRSEKFHTTYIPSDTVVCTHPNPTDG